jgi:PII-like signaling protein
LTRYARLRIYIGESDHYDHKPLYMYLLEWLHRHGFRGATVIRGIAGYGSHSKIHSVSVFRLSEDLPIIVEVVDEEEKIRSSLDEIRKLVKEGLITIEPVEVVFYGHREN